MNKKLMDDQMLSLYNARTVAYYSLIPTWGKNPPSIEKFMPLPIDKVGKSHKKEHKWAQLSEEELSKKFGD